MKDIPKSTAAGQTRPTRPTRPRAVLVTGASSGIGRAAATYLSGRGFTVFASVRREADAAALNAEGIDTLIPLCPLDLTKPAEIAASAAAVEHALSERSIEGLYAVINNAGGGQVAPLELLDTAGLSRELDTRVTGPLDLLQRLLPLLRQGRGRILWILTPGLFPVPFVGSIHASDFAATCLARTLNIELRSSGIPVTMIRCGGIQTESVERSHRNLEADLERWPPERLLPYRARLLANEAGLKQFDRKRTPAVEVAKTIHRALSAPRPRRQYRIGYLARAAALMEILPPGLADRIMTAR